jgi:alpha-glucuronidase
MNNKDEDGYELWLRYRRVDNAKRLAQFRKAIRHATVFGVDATAEVVRGEFHRALPTLLDCDIPISDEYTTGNAIVVGTRDQLEATRGVLPKIEYAELGDEGYHIRSHQISGDNRIVITGNTGPSVLTGTFHFLRILQMHQNIRGLDITSRPRIRLRILSHWDNLDGSIERGYAGKSLWKWGDLPDHIDPRYHDYARACASIGLNGAILNNVNPQVKILSSEYLAKTAALANIFRPYGIRVYLSPVLSAPIQFGDLTTSDPRNQAVSEWWKNKVDEIYRLIPDFGGFQIKANSEGQPGPQDYGAKHHDGANVLAEALKPYGGILLWRAFVYDTDIDADRAKCAYKEFVPLDGKFQENVFVQAKNGPIDFQPREPFHPLFGAMTQTPLALELQITQEYLGQSTHLVYLASMWKEILDSETYCKGPGSTIAKVVDGSLYNHAVSSIVGVANTGSDPNWCGHHFAQANWYAFGRLAWDYDLSAESIADEWTRMTWSNDPETLNAIKTMLLGSWQACINYMTPLGLHHIVQEGHHYGPNPAFNNARREDWNNVYYHRADNRGIGFNRGSTGSNAVSQYHNPLREQFDNIDSCPEKFLLWFHHVSWDYPLKSGSTLWEELQDCYRAGVTFVERMQNIWYGLRDRIDPQRYEQVSHRLQQQLENARFWKEVCINYFGRYANHEESSTRD